MNARAAIVTTLINAEHVIDSFIKYHLKLGFERIYLFFDDPNDTAISNAAKYEQVTVIRHDTSLKQKWKQTKAYEYYADFRKFIDHEVIARQMLNMEVACDLAASEGIRWILHIDIDELFYSSRQTVKEHFDELEKQGVRRFHYMNYEGVPESLSVNDYFKEVTIFKKNPNHNSWVDKIRFRKYYNNLFNYYINGKTAAQIQYIERPGISEFIFKEEPLTIGKVSRTIRLAIRSKLYYFDLLEPLEYPIILHYASCGFDNFSKKYETLGDFEDKWFGIYDVPASHGKARDVMRRKDKRSAIDFYKSQIMLTPDRIRQLESEKLLFRFNEPHRILDSKDQIVMQSKT